MQEISFIAGNALRHRTRVQAFLAVQHRALRTLPILIYKVSSNALITSGGRMRASQTEFRLASLAADVHVFGDHAAVI